MSAFEMLAAKYDIYNQADFDSYAAFIDKQFSSAAIPVREVLDIGCGTGEMTLRLSHMGYDMTGTDISAEMLFECKRKIKDEDILLLMQDMRELDLYGTVQGAISTFDCINYLSSSADLDAMFASVSLFLETGGVFVFDVNTAYAYEETYGFNSYVYESDNDMLVWQNNYNHSQKKCHFLLTMFDFDGERYVRSDEEQNQTYFTDRQIKEAAGRHSLEITNEYGSTALDACTKSDVKKYYIAVKR